MRPIAKKMVSISEFYLAKLKPKLNWLRLVLFLVDPATHLPTPTHSTSEKVSTETGEKNTSNKVYFKVLA